MDLRGRVAVITGASQGLGLGLARAFAERGLAGARFDEISVAAGHARGTIYN